METTEIFAERIVNAIIDGWTNHSRNFTSKAEAVRYWAKEIDGYIIAFPTDAEVNKQANLHPVLKTFGTSMEHLAFRSGFRECAKWLYLKFKQVIFPTDAEVTEKVNAMEKRKERSGIHGGVVWCANDIYKMVNWLREKINQSPLPAHEKYPEVNFRKQIAEEMSRTELIERLCELNTQYRKLRDEYFEMKLKEKQSPEM